MVCPHFKCQNLPLFEIVHSPLPYHTEWTPGGSEYKGNFLIAQQNVDFANNLPRG